MYSSLDKLSKILECGKFKQVRRFLESKYVNDENHDFQAETFEEGETHNTADEELELLGDYRNNSYIKPNLTV